MPKKRVDGEVVERVPGAGFGRVRLGDGRTLVFDVDAVPFRDLPELGERVQSVLLLSPAWAGETSG